MAPNTFNRRRQPPYRDIRVNVPRNRANNIRANVSQTFQAAGPSKGDDSVVGQARLSGQQIRGLTQDLQQARATNQSSKNPTAGTQVLQRRINRIRGMLAGRRPVSEQSHGGYSPNPPGGVPTTPKPPPTYKPFDPGAAGPPGKPPVGFPQEPPPARGPTESPPRGAPGPPVRLPRVRRPKPYQDYRGRPLR